MDFIDSGQTEFSVSEVFNQDLKSEMEDFLSSSFNPIHDQDGATNIDLGLNLETGIPNGMQISDLSCIDDGMQPTVSISGQSFNVADTIITSPTVNPALNFSNLSSPEKYSLESDQNIFVDPQTGLPSSQTTTVGGTHIHAQQINLFVNNVPESNSVNINPNGQGPRQGVGAQGLHIPSASQKIDTTLNGMNLNASLQIHQFSNLLSNASRNNSNSIHSGAREFQTYQLQNEHGEILGSPVKTVKNAIHKNNNLAVHRTKSAPYQVKASMKKGSNGYTKLVKNAHGSQVKDKPIFEKIYNKPGYSYSCLITMALKNSQAGCLPVSEIYQFMCENFPYFKTAKDGWKNSVRHNLSLNKCFAKVETPMQNAKSKKGCLWALNPERAAKMEEEVHKSTKRDPIGIQMCMAKPEEFFKIEALSRLTINSKTSMPKTVPNKSRSHDHKKTIKRSQVIKTIQSKSVFSSVGQATPIIIKREDDFGSLAQDIFSADLPFFESCLPPLDGDLGLQDNLVDPLHYDISSFTDLPITTSPTSLSLCSSALDSPIKENAGSFNNSCLAFENSAHTMLSNSQTYSPSKPKALSALF